MDLNFEQLLAQHNQDFKEAEIFSNWMPPDGEYIASLIKLTTGSSKKDGKDVIWWRLAGRIEDVQDEQLNGREFSVGYFTNKAFGILKGATKTLNGGELINDLGDAHVILTKSIGKIVRVKIETRPGKGANAGKDFTNCYIQEVMDTTTETASAEDVTLPGDAVTAEIPVEEVPLPEATVDGSDNPPLEMEIPTEEVKGN